MPAAYVPGPHGPMVLSFASGGGNSAAYINFIARTSGLDATHQNAYAALLNGLTTDGLFNSDGTSSYLDALYLFATADQTTALLNLVSASYTATKTGTPTFTANNGYVGSTGNYINTNFNASTAAGLYAQNSAHISVWSYGDGSGLQNIGIYSGTLDRQHIYVHHSNGNAYFRINCDSAAGVAIANGVGFSLGNRSASSAWQGYRNGSSVTSGSDASQALENAGHTFPGGSSVLGTDKIAGGSLGASLDATKQAALYNRLLTYMQTIAGWP